MVVNCLTMLQLCHQMAQGIMKGLLFMHMVAMVFVFPYNMWYGKTAITVLDELHSSFKYVVTCLETYICSDKICFKIYYTLSLYVH